MTEREKRATRAAHILAMTGSYFRGDGTAVLHPQDEARFERVIYTYYEQLNGYEYLKTLRINFRFYQGKYLDAIGEALDPRIKEFIQREGHEPNLNSPNGREVRLADALAFLRKLSREKRAAMAGADEGQVDA